MKQTLLSILAVASMTSSAAQATTWTEPGPVPDPVRQGAKCQVSQPMSSGSYIYQWPSKYDQVFWPLTDPKGIWFCQESGFTAFIGDFELSDAERAALATALAAHYKLTRKPTLGEKLALLQQSYEARKADTRTTIRLLRVLAYYKEVELKDFVAAAEFRKRALDMIESALRTEIEDAERLEYLFVSAVYYREFGDAEKSKSALSALDQALAGNKNEELKGYVEYLSELKKDIDRIVPGGGLIPEAVERQ